MDGSHRTVFAPSSCCVAFAPGLAFLCLDNGFMIVFLAMKKERSLLSA